MKKLTGILCGDLRTFLIISRSIQLAMRNISDKIFIFNEFFRK